MLQPDSVIRNRYRIIYSIDERPEAHLFRARDEQTGALVLLCTIPVTADDISGFEALARQISSLQHEAILPLLDSGREGNLFVMVSGDPVGQDLERAMRSTGNMPMNETQVLNAAIKLLEGIELLHSQSPRLVLGDPHPSDIWVVDGAWKLAPFVLIRPVGGGSSPYRAPELNSSQAEPTTTTDTYAISAILYYVLCGWPPPPTEQRQAGTQLNMPKALNPTISALAEQWLLRGLQLSERNRFHHARELRLGLETVRMMAGRSLGLGLDVFNNGEVAPAQGAPPQPTPPPVPQPTPNYPSATAAATYPVGMPMPAAPPNDIAPTKPGLSTGCLIGLTLGLMSVALLIIAALAWIGWQSGWFTAQVAAPSAVVAPTTAAPNPTTAPTSQATPAPTLEPITLAPNAISLSNANQITRTLEITADVAGPVQFSPDGRQVAIGVSNDLTLRSADLRGSITRVSGHTGKLSTIVFSPDSKLLATGAVDDPIVRLWDAQTGTLIKELRGHQGWIRSLAFSPDGRILASGSTDKNIRLWNIPDGSLLRELTGHTGILGGVSFSSDNSRLASASRDGSVRLWDVTSGQEVSGFNFRTPLDPGGVNRFWTTGVAFSPDNRQIAVGSNDSSIRLLDASSGQEIRQFTGHNSWVVIRGVIFSRDGTNLISASLDTTIRIWDVATGQQVGVLEGHQFGVSGISLSADGNRLASSSNEDGAVFLWDVAQRRQIEQLRIGQGVITTLSYAPDGSSLGSVGFNGVLQLYDFARSRGQFFVGSATTTQPLVFLDGGQFAVIDNDGDLIVLQSGQTSGRVLRGPTGRYVTVAASRDGTIIAAGTDSGQIGIWERNSDQPRQVISTQLGAIVSLALSSDGQLIAAGGPTTTSLIEVWDSQTGQQVQTLRGAADSVRSIAFQPRGGLLAAVDGGGFVLIWNPRDGSLVRTIDPQPNQERFTSLAFSPDGTILAIGVINGEILIADAGTGQIASRLSSDVIPTALAFSPDGSQLAVSLRNEAVSVFIFGLPASAR